MAQGARLQSPGVREVDNHPQYPYPEEAQTKDPYPTLLTTSSSVCDSPILVTQSNTWKVFPLRLHLEVLPWRNGLIWVKR